MTLKDIKLQYMKQVFNSTRSRTEAAKVLGISTKSAEKYYNLLLSEKPTKTLFDLENETIQKVYAETKSQRRTAKILGINQLTVFKRLKIKKEVKNDNQKEKVLFSGLTSGIRR